MPKVCGRQKGVAGVKMMVGGLPGPARACTRLNCSSFALVLSFDLSGLCSNEKADNELTIHHETLYRSFAFTDTTQ